MPSRKTPFVVLVVHRHHSGRSQDRFVQPAQAEEQEQGADDELQGGFGHPLDDELTEDHDQHCQRDEGGNRAIQWRAPAPGETYREDDGQRFDGLHR